MTRARNSAARIMIGIWKIPKSMTRPIPCQKAGFVHTSWKFCRPTNFSTVWPPPNSPPPSATCLWKPARMLSMMGAMNTMMKTTVNGNAKSQPVSASCLAFRLAIVVEDMTSPVRNCHGVDRLAPFVRWPIADHREPRPWRTKNVCWGEDRGLLELKRPRADENRCPDPRSSCDRWDLGPAIDPGPSRHHSLTGRPASLSALTDVS